MLVIENPVRPAWTIATAALPFSLLFVCLLALVPWQGARAETASKPPDYLLIKAIVPVAKDTNWWTKRHEKKVREAGAGDVGMIMIGDSLVHNFEKRGRQLWYLYFGRYQPLNLGFNADLTEHALWRLQNGELDGISPRLAIIMIGTNNGGLRRDAPQNTVAGIAAIINEIRIQLPDTKVLLLGVFPRGALRKHPLRKLNAKVNQVLPELAEEPAVRFLDISNVFLDNKGRLHRNIMYDFLHPTIAGYQLWAEAISPTVLEMMREPVQ